MTDDRGGRTSEGIGLEEWGPDIATLTDKLPVRWAHRLVLSPQFFME